VNTEPDAWREHVAARYSRNIAIQAATAASQAPVTMAGSILVGEIPMQLEINGQAHSFEAQPDTPLLWVLRDVLHMTGTKFGCGMALCGACTVHVDGQPVRACITQVSTVVGRKVTTIEAMADDAIGKQLQAAWLEVGVPQCGYCQPGQIMSAAGLLRQNPKPSDEEIDQAMSGNICRCGTYPRIRAAIKKAAAQS
jgi:isoquinoline 1-oxidoreductase subunit alpha